MPQTTPPREDLFGQLVGLARSAHVNVDLEDPADYWYRLGQRNAYAHAAGMCLAPAADPRHFTVADRITASLSDGVTDLDALTRAARAALPGHQAPTRDSAGLEWIGPKAFQARYGELPGIDHDYGMRWGASQDTRISLRHPTDATAGLLYAYNATWDEYAVLHRAHRHRRRRGRVRAGAHRGSADAGRAVRHARPPPRTGPADRRSPAPRVGSAAMTGSELVDVAAVRARHRIEDVIADAGVELRPFGSRLPGVLPLPRRLHRVPVRGRGGGPVPLLRLRRRRRRHRLHRPASPRRVP